MRVSGSVRVPVWRHDRQRWWACIGGTLSEGTHRGNAVLGAGGARADERPARAVRVCAGRGRVDDGRLLLRVL